MASDQPMGEIMPTTNNVLLLLGRLDGKMDTVLAQMNAQTQRIDGVEAKVSTQDVRLTILETNQSNSKATKAAIFAMVLAVLSSIASLFGGYFNIHT